jgi:hypothetical protein
VAARIRAGSLGFTPTFPAVVHLVAEPGHLPLGILPRRRRALSSTSPASSRSVEHRRDLRHADRLHDGHLGWKRAPEAPSPHPPRPAPASPSKRPLIRWCSRSRSGSTTIFSRLVGIDNHRPCLALEARRSTGRSPPAPPAPARSAARPAAERCSGTRIARFQFRMQVLGPLVQQPRPHRVRIASGISGMSDSPPVSALK